MKAIVDQLIALGDDPQTAEYIAKRLHDIAGDNPPEVLSAQQLRLLAAITTEVIRDARADWYANEDVPTEYKRLLDARLPDGQ